MTKLARVALGVAAFVAVMVPAAAHAQCCPGYMLATACNDSPPTKSRWCIQNTVPTGQAALPKAFCAYGDKVISTLEETFNIKAPGIFEFELDTATGGAHTGTACDHFGDGAAYDGFAGSGYQVNGFWGYLLSMHEAINDWTGLSSSGWPTDWWADHQSAFPNLMDFHIMSTIGAADNDANLTKAAGVQKGRFYPGGDTADSKVVALDNVFMAMPNGDGFAGFSHLFAMQSGDGVKWDSLGVPNPDVKRTEYVIAYMSLAAGKSVLSTLEGPGANGGGGICANKSDMQGDKGYNCDESHIDQIATAHCSIAANNKPAADLKQLRAGSYSNIPSGPCGASCPSECGCDASNHCVAPWLGSKQGGTTGPGGAGGMASSGGTANSGGGETSAGGTSTSGGSFGDGGGTLGVGGGTGGSPAAGGSVASGGSTAGAGHAGASATAGTTNSSEAGSAGSDSSDGNGCSCRTAGGSNRAPNGLLLAGAFAGLGFLRLRRRRAA